MKEEPWKVLLMLMLFMPIIALIGGIVAAIVRTAGRQKQIELTQRERIAAIERGLDPSRLPPIASFDPLDASRGEALSPRERSRRQSQGFLISGVLTFMTGLGLLVFFSVTEDHGNAWALGILPISVAVGLFLCAFLTRSNGEGRP